jgi:hypothetical protein
MSNNQIVFYYSVDSTISTITKFTVDNSIINETINGPINTRPFSDPKSKQLGTFAIHQIIYNINDIDESGRYDATGQITFFLPGGAIQGNIAIRLIKNNQNNFVGPPDKTIIYKIVSGTGLFLDSTGTMQITLNPISLERKVLICFQ